MIKKAIKKQKIDKAVRPIKTKAVIKKEKEVVVATMTSKAIENKTGEIRFADILKAVDKIKGQKNPSLDEVSVGRKLFNEIKSQSKAKRIGALYGVRIKFDPHLRPSQYRFKKDENH